MVDTGTRLPLETLGAEWSGSSACFVIHSHKMRLVDLLLGAHCHAGIPIVPDGFVELTIIVLADRAKRVLSEKGHSQHVMIGFRV